MTCPKCGADEKLSVQIYGATATVGRHPQLKIGAIMVCLRCASPLLVKPVPQNISMDYPGVDWDEAEGTFLVAMLDRDLEAMPPEQQELLKHILVAVAKMHADVGEPEQ